MRPTLLTRLARSMVYQAPHLTKPDPVVLERLTANNHWIRTQTRHDRSEYEECCGSSVTESENAQVRSELLFKDYKFRNFREAFAWMTKVAEKAEELKHHPEWFNVYNKVSVSLTTHSANSTITSLDLELAQACDKAEEEIIADRPPPKKKVQST